MKKKLSMSEMMVKIVKKNVQKEADSACAIFGYQSIMPEAAKKFSNRKKR